MASITDKFHVWCLVFLFKIDMLRPISGPGPGPARLCYQNLAGIPGSFGQQEVLLSRRGRCLVTCRVAGEHWATHIRHQLFGILQLLGREMNVGLWREARPGQGVFCCHNWCPRIALLPWVNIKVFLTQLGEYFSTRSYLLLFVFIYFTLKAIYHVNARIARIFLIKILIFDTAVRVYDYSDKYSYYELQWELYWYHYTVG